VVSHGPCVPEIRLIRPFQGRTLWGARIPGALPPATVLIPCGDQGWTVPRMFWGREKQEKGLLIRSAQAAQWKRVMRRVPGESRPVGTKNPCSFQSWPNCESVNAGGKLVSDSAKCPLTIGSESPAIQGRPPDGAARAYLRFANLPSSGSTLCLSPGNPVICYELRRELRFKRMLLEANVEPELEGKVMPAFICEVRTQFLFVAFAQHIGTEMEAFCQKSHVITVLLAISL